MRFVSKDLWIGFATLAVSVVYWVEADKIRISPLDGPVTAGGLPKALAYALGALSVVLIAKSIAGALLIGPPADRSRDRSWHESLMPHLRALGMVAIGVGYLLVLPLLGYIIAVSLLVLTVSLFAGAPLGARTILVAVGAGIIFHLLFVRFLDIPLPGGLVEAILARAGL